MGRTRIRLVTYAWGLAYVDKLLNFTLASVLAPGNMPALAAHFECEVVLLTEEALFDHVRRHPVAQRLQTIAPLRLVSLDDLIGEPWQYGMTLARALHRGMADTGAQMTETFFLFLNGDFVLADGSYERLIPHIRNGERVLLSPSYCVKGEKVGAALEARGRDGVAIDVPARAMAKIILDNRHNTVRAKTVNQHRVHFMYMDQFYWEVDKDTLLGFQMPVSLVGMRPEVALSEVGAFWDWGVVYDFCPSRKLTVLGDSDEFLMLELRGEAEHRDSLLLGWSPPEVIASRMRGYITQYQVDNAKLPLTLHAADIPPAAVPARKSLEEFRDTLLRCLPSAPIDHREHAQWKFHRDHFAEFASNRDLGREIARLRTEIGRIRTEERDQYVRLYRSYAIRAGVLEDALAAVVQTRSGALAGQRAVASPAGLGKRLYWFMFGRMPSLRPWHPLYLPYRDVSEFVRRAARMQGARLLLACDPQAPLHPAVKNLTGCCTTLSPWHLLDNAAPQEKGVYDECVIHLMVGRLEEAAEILDAALALVKSDGKITLHVANLTPHPPESWTGVLARRFIESRANLRIASTGSWPGSRAIAALTWGLEDWSKKGMFRMLKLVVSLAVSIPLAALAYVLERKAGNAGRIGRHCTSITLEIDLGAASAEHPARVVDSRPASVLV